MILPDTTSLLRPIIAAYYKTLHKMRPDWKEADLVQAVQHFLASDDMEVQDSALPSIDLIIDEDIGVKIILSIDCISETRALLRKALIENDLLQVVLVMSFKQPARLVRVNAPRKRDAE